MGTRYQWSLVWAMGSFCGSLMNTYLHHTIASFQRSHGRITEANYNAVQTIWGAEQNQGELQMQLFWEEEVTERIESEDLTKPTVTRHKTVRHDIKANPFISANHDDEVFADPDAFDIVLPDSGFAKQWNLGSDGSLWITAPDSVEQIGCIHTCQGLELDYVGVIIGPDLIAWNGQLTTSPEGRSTMDRSIRGWKSLLRQDRDGTLQRVDRIIRNTYRTLMTRGMKGCYIHCTDAETRDYFRERLHAN